MTHLTRIVSTLLLFCQLFSLGYGQYTHEFFSGRYKLEWTVSRLDKIVFTATVQTGGWVGFGLNSMPSMDGAYLVVGGVGGVTTLPPTGATTGQTVVPTTGSPSPTETTSSPSSESTSTPTPVTISSTVSSSPSEATTSSTTMTMTTPIPTTTTLPTTPSITVPGTFPTVVMTTTTTSRPTAPVTFPTVSTPLTSTSATVAVKQVGNQPYHYYEDVYLILLYHSDDEIGPGYQRTMQLINFYHPNSATSGKIFCQFTATFSALLIIFSNYL
ncbi:Transcription elongation regulator 1 [Folsomia candida]|uniref:Transcription elongation regulator 1 n=1 Tax=Folsomia candida TaxID=158441 RepID=A0A226DDU7_FOLCA|nr:Transcription elongation regulator 1 [Folsomia candida]